MAGGMTPVLEQEHFRIRTDGTAADPGTPTWLAAEDTSGNLDVTAGNVQFRIRFTVAETAGNAANSNYAIYYSKNGGTYTAISGSSSDVQFADASTSADGTALTTANFQLTAGTGTAQDGEYSEDAVVGSNISGNGNTEQEYGLVLIAADLADGNTLDFRVYYNGAAMDVYDFTPRITVDKTEITYNDLDSAAASTSTVAAAMGELVSIDGSGTSASTVAAQLSQTRAIDSAAAAVSDVQASINPQLGLDSAAQGASSVAADLDVFSITLVDLDSAIASASTGAGQVDRQSGLRATLASGSAVAAEIDQGQTFSSAIASDSTVAAELDQNPGSGIQDIDSAISASSDLQSSLNVLRGFISDLEDTSAATGLLNDQIEIDGTLASTATVAAALGDLKGLDTASEETSLLDGFLGRFTSIDGTQQQVSFGTGEIGSVQGLDAVVQAGESAVAAELEGGSQEDSRGVMLLGETLRGDVRLSRTLMAAATVGETIQAAATVGETIQGHVSTGETPQGHVIL